MPDLGVLAEKFKQKAFGAVIRNESWLDERSKKFILPGEDKTKKYESNINVNGRGTAYKSFKKDIAIEDILNKKTFGMDMPLIILNPYTISLLSALMIFNTDKRCKIKYIIEGRNGEPDFENTCDEFTDRHRIPVLGLFDGYYNRVTLVAMDKNNVEIKRKKVMIKTVKLSETYTENLLPIQKNGLREDEFILSTGGYTGGTVMFDRYGNTRFALSRVPHPYGIHMLDKDRFLYVERFYRRPNYGNAHSVVAHEMDLLGRVYRTYYDESGFHHWATTRSDNGNILFASSSRTDSYMENMIKEIDRNTGEIVNAINVNDLFDETYKTRYDWAHVNAFDYREADNSLIVCMRNIHTIAKISLNDNSLEWILTNPEFYKDTEQEDKVLQPVGKIRWFFQQHAVQIISDKKDASVLKICLFDNHVINRRPVDYFDKQKKSYLMIFDINENDGTFRQEKSIQVPLSITRSNVVIDREHNKIFGMCGNLKREDDDPVKAKIFEYDISSEKLVTKIECRKDFFAAWQQDFSINEICKPLNVNLSPVAGSLYPLKEADIASVDLGGFKEIDKQIENENRLRFRIIGNTLQIWGVDHSIEKIYLYNDKRIFVNDYTDTEQLTEIFKKHEYYMCAAV